MHSHLDFTRVFPEGQEGATFLQFLAEAGYVHQDLGRWSAAAEVFQGLAHLVPDDPTAHLGLASTHLVAGDSARAERAARRAAEAGRANSAQLAQAYYLRGLALAEQGRDEQARACFADLRDVAPDHPYNDYVSEEKVAERLLSLRAKERLAAALRENEERAS